jgi:DNA-binding beta-propeller fold protein YncE
MVLVQEQPTVELDAEALFREARRRERLRRASIAAAGLVVAALIIGAVALLNRGAGAGTVGAAKRLNAPSPSVVTVSLKHPASLAVSSAGVLYIVDPARDQILRRLHDGGFAVVAGSGRQGFSGDGSRATRAALRLTGSSSVAVSASGILYFTDSGNNRVRAVLPDGRIETVAGEARHYGIPRTVSAPYLTGSRPALRTDLIDPTGLAFGPGGKLYLAAQDVVALSRRGTLSYFAGSTHAGYSSESRLIDGYPTGITFDRAGDMFVSNFPSLLERTASGRILFLGDGFRSGDGGFGILASSPDGNVYEALGDAEGLVNQLRRPQAVPNGNVMSTHGLQTMVPLHGLDRVLGTRDSIRNGFGPTGLAISTNGTIYTDTDSAYWSSVSALVEISPSGHVRSLWTSR